MGQKPMIQSEVVCVCQGDGSETVKDRDQVEGHRMVFLGNDLTEINRSDNSGTRH